MDSRSVKTTEESAHPSGYDAHKNVKGRKRHLLVDTLGLLLSVYVSPADVQDRGGAQGLLAGLKLPLPRLKKIWAGGAYTGETLAGWCKEQGEWELEIVERSSSANTEGFTVLPHKWIRGAYAWMVDAEPPFEQRLRAAGADKRGDLQRGCDDPPDIEAAGEGSVNLTKQALKTTSLFTPCSFARSQLRCRTSGRWPQIFQSTPDLGAGG
jgi:transposase